MIRETCFGEGGLTVDNFGDVKSFQCPDCEGTGKTLPQAIDPTESPSDSGSRIGGSHE